MDTSNEILLICETVKKMADIEKIIVFGIKRSEKTNIITDLDICVVANINGDRKSWLKKAYLETDSEIPFDIFLYSPEEWNRLIQDSASFASRILRKGYLMYEKKENA